MKCRWTNLTSDEKSVYALSTISTNFTGFPNNFQPILLHKIKLSLKLKNLSLYIDWTKKFKKLKSISNKRSSSVNNSVEHKKQTLNKNKRNKCTVIKILF